MMRAVSGDLLAWLSDKDQIPSPHADDEHPQVWYEQQGLQEDHGVEATTVDKPQTKEGSS